MSISLVWGLELSFVFFYVRGIPEVSPYLGLLIQDLPRFEKRLLPQSHAAAGTLSVFIYMLVR